MVGIAAGKVISVLVCSDPPRYGILSMQAGLSTLQVGEAADQELYPDLATTDETDADPMEAVDLS
jgi:hypothetical protein